MVAREKGIKEQENWSVIGQQNFLALWFEACDVEILRYTYLGCFESIPMVP